MIQFFVKSQLSKIEAATQKLSLSVGVGPVAGRPSQAGQDRVKALNEKLAQMSPTEMLQWAVKTGDVLQFSSFGPSGMVIIDMLAASGTPFGGRKLTVFSYNICIYIYIWDPPWNTQVFGKKLAFWL